MCVPVCGFHNDFFSWQNKEEVLVDEWSKQARDLLLGFAEKINLPNRYSLHIPNSKAIKDYEWEIFLKICQWNFFMLIHKEYKWTNEKCYLYSVNCKKMLFIANKLWRYMYIVYHNHKFDWVIKKKVHIHVIRQLGF